MLIQKSCSDFHLTAIYSTPNSFSELEESLLVMPFHYTADILCILNEFVKERRDVELSCRCIFFLLKLVELILEYENMLNIR